MQMVILATVWGTPEDAKPFTPKLAIMLLCKFSKNAYMILTGSIVSYIQLCSFTKFYRHKTVMEGETASFKGAEIDCKVYL